MVSMMLLHKSQMVADFIRGEKRWPVPTELGPGGLFKREIRGLTVGILGVSWHGTLASVSSRT